MSPDEAVYYWMGILAAYEHSGRMVPRWTRPHIAIAAEIAENGATFRGPIALARMVDGAKEFQAETARRVSRRKVNVPT